MNKVIILLTFLLLSPSGFSKNETTQKIVYYKNLFGHIHKNPSRYSQSLSTISCGHPIKILGIKGKEIQIGGFSKVKVGPYVGYIDRKYLSSRKMECFQDRYPRFFDNIGLTLSDMYYWGKLYDQYVYGRSTIQ